MLRHRQLTMDTIEHYFKSLGAVSPAVFTAMILMGVNLILRRTPQIRNGLIPWLSVVAGMILFPIFVPAATDFPSPLGRNIGMGFLSGLGAAFGYGAIWRFAETRWPWLHGVINGPEAEAPKKKSPPDDPPASDPLNRNQMPPPYDANLINPTTPVNDRRPEQ